MITRIPASFLAASLFGSFPCLQAGAANVAIPLPEHPRPDFARADWVNLNGPWQFRFDGDLHSPFYISTGDQLCRDAKPGETVEVPLLASFMTDRRPGRSLALHAQLYGWDSLGRREVYFQTNQSNIFEPWLAKELPALKIAMPKKPAVAVLSFSLQNEAGVVLQRNFTTFLVASSLAPRVESLKSGGRDLHVVRFASPSNAEDRTTYIAARSPRAGARRRNRAELV